MMRKRTILTVALAVGLMVMATAAYAQGPGYGRGMGYGGGGWHMGQGGGPGYGPAGFPGDDKFFEETAELRANLRVKTAELDAVMAAKEIDEAKAKALVGEINDIRGQLSQKRLEAEIDFRKNNPDAYRQYASGRGRGPGGGGYGPGYCWR